MEDLYIEKFSGKSRNIEITDQLITPIFKAPENTYNENRERIYQMTILVGQLENWTKEFYKDDEGIHYLVENIRKKIVEKSLEGVIAELTKLEELFDLSLPFNRNDSQMLK